MAAHIRSFALCAPYGAGPFANPVIGPAGCTRYTGLYLHCLACKCTSIIDWVRCLTRAAALLRFTSDTIARGILSCIC